MSFDTRNQNNFAVSKIREFLNGEFLQRLIDAGAPEEMFKYFTVDLTADDGLKDYGNDLVRVGLITCDEYRCFRENIPTFTDKWWWTATPHSPKNGFVRNVTIDGTLVVADVNDSNGGVHPICVFKTGILEVKNRMEAIETIKQKEEPVWNLR